MLADARSTLPFANNSFDDVIQFFLNRYIENQGKEMEEIVRVLRPGGRFIMMDHARLRHPEEVSRFNPERLKEHPVLKNFHDLRVQEISPEVDNPSINYYRGSLYIFTGVKPT